MDFARLAIRSRRALFAQGVLLLAIVFATASTESAAANEAIDYEQHIKPLLEVRCYACHGALRQQSGLRLDAAALIRKGGGSGPAIVPGKASESLLIERVTEDEDFRMPPAEEGERLSPEEVQMLRRWIDGGAKAPADEPIPEDPRKHWAYQPPVKSPVPNVDRGGWVRAAIDAFIAERHIERGLEPLPEADQATLLRRVYLDLIGLPPTRDQLRAFLADDSPQAYANVVDRLLASERHGERWGRHWMDVWRYSDWSGYRNEIRNSQRHIWHWRDWIIESLNEDKGYDRMVREMLAGDEIAPANADVLRATGYLCRSWFKFNRNTWLDGTVEHVAKGFLGLTINCARCHDHKYDPVAQQDYYRLRAFFEAHDVRTDRVPGESDVAKNGLPRVMDSRASDPTYLFVRGSDKQPDKENPLEPGLPTILDAELEIEQIELPPQAYYPALQDWVIAEEQAAAEKKLQTAREALARDQAELDALLARRSRNEPGTPPEPLAGRIDETQHSLRLSEKRVAAAEAFLASLRARVAAERAKYGLTGKSQHDDLAKQAAAAERESNLQAAQLDVMEAEQVLARWKAANDPKQKKALAEAQKKQAAAVKQLQAAQQAAKQTSPNYSPLGKTYTTTSTGRRRALAEWITSRDNPLTARVAVNHIWMRHFGTPLVESVFDFGLRADEPRHRRLLDWLAVELMENGWSMKHLHKLIVTSSTYRMASASANAPPANRELDPDNHEYWRFNVRRLEAEVVRDSVLHVAGNLDLTTGGPEIPHTQGQTVPRRSVYFQHAYEKQMNFLQLFDAASVNECYRRSTSVVPQQALALANSQLSLEQSRHLAAELQKVAATEAPEDARRRFIEVAFEQVLARSPSSKELDYCTEFLAAQTELLSDPKQLTQFAGGSSARVAPSRDPAQRARENLVHVLLNHNDFVTVR